MKSGSKYLITGVLMLLLVSLALVGPVSAVVITKLPYTITTSDTYTLGQNFNNFKGPVAIDVQASNVVIDGQGFKLDGVDNANSIGIRASSYMKNGIMYKPTKVTIQNVKVSDFANGVLYYQTQGGVVSGNMFTSNANAVIFQVVKNSKILDNDFAGNGNGVILWTTTTTAVNDNEFSKDSIAGITIGFGSSATNILRNTFNSDMLAILLNSGSTTATIKNNKVYAIAAGDALKTGIQIAGSSGNTIYNNIFDTYNNVKATNTDNVWCLASAGKNIVGGPSIGGNAWEMPNWAGFSQIMPDINGDGFTDNTNSWTPVTATFFINNKNQDFLPLKV